MNNKYYYAIFWSNFDNFRGIFVSDKKYVDSAEICKKWCEYVGEKIWEPSCFIAYDATDETVVSHST